MNTNIDQSYGSSFRSKKTDTSEITELKEVRFNNKRDVFIKEYIGLKNYAKVFYKITGRNNIRAKINSI